jgi:acetyltransferase-like isoleucine patch superfamily enzyme
VGEGVHVMGAATIAGGVRIGDHSTIATNATVLPNIRIGSNSVVGAGAVVIKDVPDNVVVAGVPAKIIRPR